MTTKTKSAAQIQAEIHLIRMAYEDRERRHEPLNRYLAEPSPVTKAAVYLVSAASVIGAIAFIVSLFL